MKKRATTLLVVLCVAVYAFADDVKESSIPAAVKNVLYTSNPQAKNVEWEYKAKRGYYEAEFRVGRLEHEMKISTDGKLIYSKRDINLQDIPQKIADYIDREYGSPKILGAEFIYANGSEEYEVGVRYRNSFANKWYLNLRFTKDGILLHEYND